MYVCSWPVAPVDGAVRHIRYSAEHPRTEEDVRIVRRSIIFAKGARSPSRKTIMAAGKEPTAAVP